MGKKINENNYKWKDSEIGKSQPKLIKKKERKCKIININTERGDITMYATDIREK